MNNKFNKDCIDPNCFVGQSAKFALVIPAAAINTVALNQDFIYNQHVDNDTKIPTGECCERAFFIRNNENTAEIFLNLRGMYLILFETQSSPAVGNAVSVITERESRFIPLSTGNTGFAIIYNNEERMTARIRNTGAAPIVETQGANPNIDVHSTTVIYLGTGRR